MHWPQVSDDDMKYSLHSNFWVGAVPFTSEFANISSSDFAADYLRVWGIAANHITVSAFSSLCVLATAIERAGTTDQTAVQAQLMDGSFEETMGVVKFDSVTGQNDMDMIVLQVWDAETHLVSPVGSTSEQLVFPTPPWAQRACFAKATPECSGNGDCSQAGVCECVTPYSGDICNIVEIFTETKTGDHASIAVGSLSALLLICLVGVTRYQQRARARLRMRVAGTGRQLPVPRPPAGCQYALFLSHCWRVSASNAASASTARLARSSARV